MKEPPKQRSLLQQAQALLAHKPLPATELSRRVLRLEGHPQAASVAVSTLLGSDNRFSVNENDVWSLTAGATRPGPPLATLPYAVVDVETTGGTYERGHRITEVAIVEVTQGEISGEFHTLVNPCRRIPPSIANLTGINDRILATAPLFDEIADEVSRRLTGRIFVAHNVAFDWNWISAELADAIGEVPDTKRLCTVSMARRLLPEIRRRNLDAVAEFFGVTIHQRHRAYGDALATARVLLRLLDRASTLGLSDLHALQRYQPRRRRQNRNQMKIFTDAELSVLGGPRI